MMERITVSCSTSQDLHEWLEHLQRLTKGTCNTVSKTQSWSAHSVSELPPNLPAARYSSVLAELVLIHFLRHLAPPDRSVAPWSLPKSSNPGA